MSGFFGDLQSRIAGVRPEERRALAIACIYGFSIFTAYAVIKPLRDAMGITGGVRDLPWLFGATLLAMLAAHPLYAALVARWPPSFFVGFSSRFFALNLGLFLILGGILQGNAQLWLARVFFVWTSVFNLFVLSIFWSFLSDLFNEEQARRLFGLIALGVTLGAIAGSGLTSALSEFFDPIFLLPLSMVLLEIAARCARSLCSWREEHGQTEEADKTVGGGIGEGFKIVSRSPYLIGIAGFMLLYTITATFLYFLQGEVVAAAFVDRGARTAFFARIDLAVNCTTILVQVFATGRVMKKWGVGVALVALPLLCISGFIWVGLAPSLTAIAVFQILRRSSNYAVTRPAREVLYTVVSQAERYKAKNLIDTAVYRAGDQLGAWSWALIGVLGFATATTAWVAAPLSILWVALALWLGRQFNRKRSVNADHQPTQHSSPA